MASLAQMKAEAAKQGAQAPPDYPGGPDAWVADWYANAKAAGSIESERPANYAGPQDAEAQGYNYSQGVGGASGWQPGQSITPQQLRKLSREQGWSEDFNRYSDAQLQTWINQSWDPQSGRFRSEGGGGALVEKPTECPEGTTLHGSKCVSWESLPWELGGGGGMGGGAAGGGGGMTGLPSIGDGNDALQQRLIEMYQGREGMFGAGPASQAGVDLEGGGIWWSQNPGTANPMAPVNPALAQAALTAFTPNAPSQQPVQPAGAPAPTTPRQAMPEASNITSATSELMKQVGSQPTTPQSQVAAAAAPLTGQGALTAAINQRFNQPAKWWMDDANRVAAV